MSGRVKQACIHSLSDDYDPNQSTLEDYGSDVKETKISVMSSPNEDMLSVVDEAYPELGMPEKLLQKFWKRRSDYRMNSAIDDPHNRAYTELNLDEEYREYIRGSQEAQRALSELVNRVRSGEQVTLVCVEESHEMCHRHVLREMLLTRIQNNLTAVKRVIQ